MDANLGRIKLHDPKSRAFAYPREAPEVGKSIRHRMMADNVDQFYTSGCVGFSGTNLLNTRTAYKSRKRYNNYVKLLSWNRALDNNDGLKNYSEATKRDPFPWTYEPDDEGSSALGLMKWWQDAGIITGYDWCFTFGEFLAALQKQPVLVGTWWYDSMFHPDLHGIIHPTGGQVGGHEYMADAIVWYKEPSKRLIGFDNSWGESFSLKGKFYMFWEEFEALLADEGDAVVPRLL